MLDLKQGGHELAKQLTEALASQSQSSSNVSNVRPTASKNNEEDRSNSGGYSATENNQLWATMAAQQPTFAVHHQNTGSHPSEHQQSSDRTQGSGQQREHNGKPTVGSEEWHRQRRENHKQVERRRRETINEGINEIAKMVPGSEKNKGSILQRAAQYIQQLKDNEAATIEKWTLEKLLTDQAINELSQQVEVLKNEVERLRQDNDRMKRQLGEDKEDDHSKKKQKTDHSDKSDRKGHKD
ncbi:basic helix-loop-helix protein [Umbelopsis sp. WA50703]